MKAVRRGKELDSAGLATLPSPGMCHNPIILFYFFFCIGLLFHWHLVWDNYSLTSHPAFCFIPMSFMGGSPTPALSSCSDVCHLQWGLGNAGKEPSIFAIWHAVCGSVTAPFVMSSFVALSYVWFSSTSLKPAGQALQHGPFSKQHAWTVAAQPLTLTVQISSFSFSFFFYIFTFERPST